MYNILRNSLNFELRMSQKFNVDLEYSEKINNVEKYFDFILFRQRFKYDVIKEFGILSRRNLLLLSFKSVAGKIQTTSEPLYPKFDNLRMFGNSVFIDRPQMSDFMSNASTQLVDMLDLIVIVDHEIEEVCFVKDKYLKANDGNVLKIDEFKFIYQNYAEPI